MATYDEVMQEVNARVNALVQKGAGLSQADAISAVFKADLALYERYRRAKPAAPTASARPQPQPRGAEAEVLAKADTLMAKTAGLSQRDAIARVLHADPALYSRYRKQDDGAAAPTFGGELLTRQLDDVSESTSALQTAIAGILRSDAADKGAKLAGAVDDFRATVLEQLRQAGLSVPTAKRGGGLVPPHLETAVLEACQQLSPTDPLGTGAMALRKSLQAVVRYWREHEHRAA